MASRQRKAAAAIAQLSKAERLALRSQAAAAIRQDGCGGYCHFKAVAQSDRLAAISRDEWLAMEAASHAMQAAEFDDIRAKEAAAAASHAKRLAAAAAESSAWDRLAAAIIVSNRASVVSNPLIRLAAAIDKAAAASRLAAIAQPLIAFSRSEHHWTWFSRPVRVSYPASRPNVRVKAYPMGYASSRGSWSYRAGADRTMVAGGTGAVSVRISHSEAATLVPSKWMAMQAASGIDPAIALKWSRASGERIEVKWFETVDYSLRAVTGVNTASGYRGERHGRVNVLSAERQAASPLADRIKRLAIQAAAADRRTASRLARVQRWRDERLAAERRREAARLAAAAAMLPRLVKD